MLIVAVFGLAVGPGDRNQSGQRLLYETLKAKKKDSGDLPQVPFFIRDARAGT